MLQNNLFKLGATSFSVTLMALNFSFTNFVASIIVFSLCAFADSKLLYEEAVDNTETNY